MPVSRSTARLSALIAATLALVAIGGVVPASAAPVVTIDPIPGEPLLTPAAGPVTLVLSGDADAGTEVTIATDDIPSGVVTPICGPVTAGSDDRWTCTATDVADWVGRLRADVFSSPVYSTPVSVIAAPTLTGTPATGTDTTPTISGTVPAGGVSSELAVTVDGAPACTATAAPGATWSCDVPTGLLTVDGAYEIGATQTKDFGGGQLRTSIATTADYVLDTTGPSIPATFTTPASSPHIITTPAVSLAGTAEAGGSVTVMAGATVLCAPVTVTGGGTWSCGATFASAGTRTLSIVQTDALGNAATVPSETVDVAYIPPVVVAPPTIYVAPPIGTSIEYTFDPNDLKVGFATTETRETAQELAIQSLETLCDQFEGVVGAVPLGQVVPTEIECKDAFAPVETTLPLTLPAASDVYTCEALYSSAFSVTNCGNITWTTVIHSEPTTIGTGSLDPEQPTTVELRLPASVAAGEHRIELTFVDEANPDAEPVVMSMPITLVAPESPATPEPADAPEPDAAAGAEGIGAWLWVIMALAVAAVIATSVFLVRRGRS